ncbi:hypothetical protein [Streptomyces sp. cg36]|uniref:hypothetical protein n=1 Tax=Streptomyces sp. cg36 TaxID=3238798 RepID=UPI0034E23AF9
MMGSKPLRPAIVVTSTTVMRGDVIEIGGRHFEITDLIDLSGRARRLRFRTGETLTMSSTTRLLATRPTARR